MIETKKCMDLLVIKNTGQPTTRPGGGLVRALVRPPDVDLGMGGAAPPFEGRGGRARFGRGILVRLPEDIKTSFEEDQPLYAGGEGAGPRIKDCLCQCLSAGE